MIYNAFSKYSLISQAVNGFALSLCQAGASATRKAPAQGDEQLMSIEDLAAYFKVKTQTLYDWARNKRIRPIETYVRRERNTALSYSTRPKRGLLNEPFRPRGFLFML
jgi:hypothetical protein